MKTMKPDEILWELGASEAAALETPTDDELRAYVEQTLSEEETAALEARLAASPEGRERLATLAGLDLGGPSPQLRERVLEHLPGPKANGHSKSEGRRRTWFAAAAAAILALVVTGYQLTLPAPELPAYSAHLGGGLSVDRSGEPSAIDATSSGPIEAYADNPISVSLQPDQKAGPDRVEVGFGLYRLTGDRLEPVRLVQEAKRYQTIFELPARELVGSEPGLHRFYTLEAHAGKLPKKAIDAGQDPVAALEQYGKVRALEMQLVAEPEEELSAAQ